jgi:hypothetical protein
VSSVVTVICCCPLCNLIYRQDVAHRWGGKVRHVRTKEVTLHALCEENGQGRERDVWVGVAYCADCSLQRVPPILRETMEQWLWRGERK